MLETKQFLVDMSDTEDIYDDVQPGDPSGAELQHASMIYDNENQEIYDDVEATASTAFVDGTSQEENQACYTGLLTQPPPVRHTPAELQYTAPTGHGLTDSSYTPMASFKPPPPPLPAKVSVGSGVGMASKETNFKHSTASLNALESTDNEDASRSKSSYQQYGGRKNSKLASFLCVLVLLSNFLSLGALAVATVLLVFWRMEVADYRADLNKLTELFNMTMSM